MSGWKEVRLGEICHYVTDRIDCSVLNKDNYISTENMAQNCGGVSDATNVPDGKCIAFKENDVLFSNIRPYFKKLWKADFDGGCSADVLCIRANNNVNQIYLYYLLTQDSFISYVMKGSKGCKMPRGDKEFNMKWKISIPSLSTQHQIASILSALDDKIAVNRRICENLESQAQALFKHWFIDFAPFKDGKFVESELGMIPEGWRVGSLTEIADYLNGLAMQKFPPLSEEDAIPVLKIKELGQSSCDANSDKCSKQIKPEYIIKDGDVVFSWSGTLLIDIWCSDLCGLNQHLFKVTSENYPKWFYLMWTKHHLAEFIRIAKDKAVTMGHIKRGDLDNALVAIPNEDALYSMTELMEKLINKIINARLESSRLSTLRDTLLPKLMSGQIKV